MNYVGTCIYWKIVYIYIYTHLHELCLPLNCWGNAAQTQDMIKGMCGAFRWLAFESSMPFSWLSFVNLLFQQQSEEEVIASVQLVIQPSNVVHQKERCFVFHHIFIWLKFPLYYKEKVWDCENSRNDFGSVLLIKITFIINLKVLSHLIDLRVHGSVEFHVLFSLCVESETDPWLFPCPAPGLALHCTF